MWRGVGTGIAAAALLTGGNVPSSAVAAGHHARRGHAEPIGAVALVPLPRRHRALHPAATPEAATRARPACSGATRLAWTTPIDRERTTVLCLLNRERAMHGLSPVVPDMRLVAAATAHSAAMRDHHFFSHYGPGGDVRRRVAASGYLRGARRWVLGETLAWATGALATPTAMVSALMHSPPHRRIILSPAYREAGVGVVLGVPASSALGATLTVDFGTR